MDIEQIHSKWIDWLDKIEERVMDLVLRRHVYREVVEIVKSNPRINVANVFHSLVHDTYITYISVGIRQQLDTNQDAISLRKLLKELSEHSHIMTRRRYLTLYPPHYELRLANKDFNRFADPDAPYLNKNMVGKDMESLLSLAEPVKDFADRSIIHNDRRGITMSASFGDLDRCQDVLEQLVLKYVHLFRGAVMTTLVPAIQYDWKEILTHSWISS